MIVSRMSHNITLGTNRFNPHTTKKTNKIKHIAITAPLAIRCAPWLRRCSPHEIILPNHTMGCGNRDGSPKMKSSNQPNSNGNININADIISLIREIRSSLWR